MSPHHSLSPSRAGRHNATRPSPLRHASNISNSSAEENNAQDPVLYSPTRPAFSPPTTALDTYHSQSRKRSIRETSPTKTTALPDYQYMNNERPLSRLDQTERPTLRPLHQGENMMPPSSNQSPSVKSKGSVGALSAIFDGSRTRSPEPTKSTKPNPKQQYSIGLSRSDSKRAPTAESRGRARQHEGRTSPPPNVLDSSELEKLGRSTTGHLRTLSKLTGQGGDAGFKIKSKEEQVTGMHGRRRLQLDPAQNGRKMHAPGYGGRTWMDKQRQFLQAYEYLCHIGEAKEWIEDIINKPIPAIVQLEEALRDGVTLAEIVQALQPDRKFRLFQHQRLQFRHSDNIAIFFRFLSEVELPDLFRFELVDLYEKKNIPRVIYCIHALSWLLFRKGIVDFRIGNLVGQLQFEDHELEDMQKGLDKAGISMPNFSSLAPEPEPEPEPVETEDGRIERELQECSHAVEDFQAQARGALMRLQLGDSMQYLWDYEHLFVELQSKNRGDFARQISGYRLQMRHFAKGLQSISRGYLLRSRERKKERHWKDREKDIVILQSLVRARAARAQTKHLKSRISDNQHGLKQLQAIIRAATQRGVIADKISDLEQARPQIVSLQSVVRGHLARQKQHATTKQAAKHHHTWTSLASVARAHLVKRQMKETQTQLRTEQPLLARLQAKMRGNQTRAATTDKIESFRQHDFEVRHLQAAARAFASRSKHQSVLRSLQTTVSHTSQLQGLIRGYLARSRVFDVLDNLNQHESAIVDLQAIARAMMIRHTIADDLDQLDSEGESIEQLQASIRGMLVRAKFEEKRRFYRENMKKVIKIQSFVRGRQQGEAYKSLTTGKNPPVGTVKNFVHLLNDSDFDFDEEIESEKLQKTLLQRVQGNEHLEHLISDMDTKIGLLAQTKITSDEAVKMRKNHSAFSHGTMDRHGSVRDSFNPKSLNRSSKAKIDRYGELVYYLQTQPQYFARLFRKTREHGTVNVDSKKLETLIMGIFAFAQKRREEYLLLKLISTSMKEELDGCANLDDFIRGNFFFSRLFNAYTRVPRDRKYVKQAFGQVMRSRFVDNSQLDLDSDPLQIYRALLSDEQLRTGRPSSRPADLSREEVIKDPEVRSIYVRHLMDTRAVVGEVLSSLEDTLGHMPFGTRFITQQMFALLQAKFPRADEEHLLTVTGSWLWRTYFKLAVTEPESCGVVERQLEPKQRRNLAQVAKVVGQITLGRLFDVEDQYLGPLNQDVQASIGRWRGFLYDVMQIPAIEAKYDISEFNDLYAKVKPTLYIKMPDVLAAHEMIANELSFVCVSQEDNTLREVLRDLGNPKNNEAEMGAGSAEVTLTLGGRVHAMHDPDAEIKNLFMETKRCVLYIIRIQNGSNLLDIMVKPITPDDELRWSTLVHDELSASKRSSRTRAAYAEPTVNNNLSDLASMSYAELKSIALENILSLEAAGRLSRHNQYQDLLNEIAVDIRQKHRRRVQRQQEIERTRQNIRHLEEKHRWLDERLTAYADTYDQNLVILQGKSAKDRLGGKSKFLMPFSKQWHHQREMERLGREPRYGSYKRSAEHFAAKGILLSWEGHDLRNDDITISSDQINQFLIEGSSGSMMITGASDAFSWDDLLDAEYNGQEVYEFFVEAGRRVHGGGGHGLSHGGSVRDGGRSGGAKRDVLRMDTKMFKAWMSKKFFPDA